MSEMLTTLICLSLIMSLLIIFSHPLTLVLSLVGQTLTIILFFYHKTSSPWMSMILFLIFLGGLLIIFSYLSALIPNEMYSSNKLGSFLFLCPIFMSGWILEMNPIHSSNSLEHLSNEHTLTLIPLLLIFIILMLCLIMYLCLSVKNPLKQENF